MHANCYNIILFSKCNIANINFICRKIINISTKQFSNIVHVETYLWGNEWHISGHLQLEKFNFERNLTRIYITYKEIDIFYHLKMEQFANAICTAEIMELFS